MVRCKRVFGAAAFACLASMSGLATAEDLKTEKFEIELGDIPRFGDEAAAIASCIPDSVVWADRRNGFYYPKFFSDYGKTPNGSYTCFKQAVKADYWSLTPSSDGGHKGREFPLFFCTSCS